jgi:SAM-dependent methyltransferase
MDLETLRAYESEAASYAEQWEHQPEANDLHTLIQTHFERDLTADIGCGSGRETAWLVSNGYPAVGYDASDSLLAECRRSHPGPSFLHGELPDLATLPRERYANVLCETVIMHLSPIEIPGAVRSLLGILRPAGTLYLSWRVNTDGDERDASGRLYSNFPASLVRDALGTAVIVHDSEQESASSGRRVHVLLAGRGEAG